MTEKKKYIVTVTKVSGGWHGQEIRETKDIITYATSKAKAENNARFRTEGKAYWCETHGSDANYYRYQYEAREA